MDRRRENNRDNRDSENDSFPDELIVLVLVFNALGDNSLSDDLRSDQDVVSFNFSRRDLRFRKLSFESSLVRHLG